jgi:glycerol-3-phosphate dehydrogenase (NAD(P)+)
MKRITIVGAGAWGTALAMVVRAAGREAMLWALEPKVAESINADDENPIYLPGVKLDPAIRAHTSLSGALDGADAVLLTVPAQHLRGVTEEMARLVDAKTPLVVCAKGIEAETGALMTEVVDAVFPGGRIAVLSGPTFAIEVARGLPTAVTLASANPLVSERMVQAIGSARFRPYSADDPIGAEIGGAVKNVIAIACGIVEGRGLGENARAALITRGLAEIVRLGAAKGAKPETMMGLCGLGDLTLTCNSLQSRNMSLGAALGQGRTLRAVLDERAAVTEGVWTAPSVVGLAERMGVDMPICAAVNRILHGGAEIDAEIEGLLSRPFKAE